MFANLLFSLLLVESDSIAVDGGAVSIFDKTFDEVVVNAAAGQQKQTTGKGVETLDEHLARLRQADLVKRGAYASEVSVNSMQTERVSTTIDGMKIFCACTDRMDPVTSYVETSNLSRIFLNSGLGNDPQATGNLGGSVDLKLRKAGFDSAPFEMNVQTGFETNGCLQSYLVDLALSSEKRYLNTGISFRDARNYQAGGNREIDFSQYQKFNVFANGGRQWGDGRIVEFSAIYDLATDVGYPSLTMDVKKAEGLITALAYRQEQFRSPLLTRWESKVYYNNIRHEMDDTHRPDVVMHMDMPGLSRTSGLYSLLAGSWKQHLWQLNLDGYLNRSRAEMTMYPSTYGTAAYNPADRMFMLTWPDVQTGNSGLSVSDQWGNFRLTLKGSLQWSHISDPEGLATLRIYYPTLSDRQFRREGRVTLHYRKDWQKGSVSVGTGWGSRTPTVTEAYGYFLYNTLDGYDYLGNPELKNEKAVQFDLSGSWSPAPAWEFSADGNLFLFDDYIQGGLTGDVSGYSPMTIGALGVKQYRNLPSATIANLSFDADWQLSSAWRWQNRIGWSWGKDNRNRSLPLIAPLQFRSTLAYEWGSWEGSASVIGAARKEDAARHLGEHSTPGYVLFNLQAGYLVRLAGKVNVTLKAGVENVLDKYYTTYASWNGIGQKGRNFFASLQASF